MKIYFSIILLTLLKFLSNDSNAQISGYVKNNAGQGLEGKVVEVHLTNNLAGGIHQTWYHTTNQQGRFAADPTTTDIDDIIPKNYKIDAPYPNPFNPSVTISLPVFKPGNYKLKLYNIIGEEVESYAKELEVGIHKFQINEPGAAGIYFFSLIGENSYIFSDKLCYLGGGMQEVQKITYLSSNVLPKQMRKITDEAFTLDSIRIRGDAIQTKTFPFTIQTNGTIDVLNLTVDSAFVNINGKIYKLFDWQQQNNGIEGATVKIGNRQTSTDANGNYIIQASTGLQWLEISHPNTWTRKTKIIAYNSATLPDMNVMDKTRMPEDYLAFFDSISSRIGDPVRPPPKNILSRWMKNINPCYIVVNTNFARDIELRDTSLSTIQNIWKPLTKTPLYPQGFLKDIVVETGPNPPPDFTQYSQIYRMTEDLGGPFALSYMFINSSDTTSQTYEYGEVFASLTKYWRDMPGGAWALLKDIVLHEQARQFMGLTSAIFNPTKISIFNAGLGLTSNEPTEYDKRWILYTYSRMTGSRTPDTDYNILDAASGKWLNPINGKIVKP